MTLCVVVGEFQLRCIHRGEPSSFSDVGLLFSSGTVALMSHARKFPVFLLLQQEGRGQAGIVIKESSGPLARCSELFLTWTLGYQVDRL